MRGRWYRRWFFRAFAVVLSVMLTFAIVELWFVVMVNANLGGSAYRGNALPLWEAVDDHRPFALRSNFEHDVRTRDFEMHIKTNDFGLREDQSMDRLLDHDFRILSMGDSMTFGYGVNYGERYSDLLNDILGDQAIAFTSGYADGFSPVDYAGYLRGFYSYLLPDIVVVGFFPENDVVNDVLTRRIERDAAGDVVGTKLNGFTVVDGFLTAEGAPRSSIGRGVVRIKHWMWDTFTVYRLAEEARNIIRYKLQPELANQRLPPFILGLPGNHREIDITLGAIDQMDRLLRARSKTLLVVFIPSNFQIAQEYEATVTRRPGYRVSSEQMETARVVREPQTGFSRWLAERGIRYIDPTEEFVQAELQGTQLYFDYDGHINLNGHARVATLVKDYLLDNRLVPCSYLTPEAAAGAECQP